MRGDQPVGLVLLSATNRELVRVAHEGEVSEVSRELLRTGGLGLSTPLITHPEYRVHSAVVGSPPAFCTSGLSRSTSLRAVSAPAAPARASQDFFC